MWLTNARIVILVAGVISQTAIAQVRSAPNPYGGGSLGIGGIQTAPLPQQTPLHSALTPSLQTTLPVYNAPKVTIDQTSAAYSTPIPNTYTHTDYITVPPQPPEVPAPSEDGGDDSDAAADNYRSHDEDAQPSITSRWWFWLAVCLFVGWFTNWLNESK